MPAVKTALEFDQFLAARSGPRQANGVESRFRPTDAKERHFGGRHVFANFIRELDFRLGRAHAGQIHRLKRLDNRPVDYRMVVPKGDWTEGTMIVEIFFAGDIVEFGALRISPNNGGTDGAGSGVNSAWDVHAGSCKKSVRRVATRHVGAYHSRHQFSAMQTHSRVEADRPAFVSSAKN